jgi:hypothetical protein
MFDTVQNRVYRPRRVFVSASRLPCFALVSNGSSQRTSSFSLVTRLMGRSEAGRRHYALTLAVASQERRVLGIHISSAYHERSPTHS